MAMPSAHEMRTLPLTMQSQHVPILRYLARKVGGYDGETNLDKFTVDAVTAAYEDWRVCSARVPPRAALSGC